MSASARAATPAEAKSNAKTIFTVLVIGCLISMIGFGIRSTFGVFLEPMTEARGWTRETYALAMAIQNLLWGIGTPIAGAISERFGPVAVMVL